MKIICKICKNELDSEVKLNYYNDYEISVNNCDHCLDEIQKEILGKCADLKEEFKDTYIKK